MGSSLSAENRTKAEQFFKKIDSDGSGFITLKELQAVVHLKPATLKKMILAVDTDGNKRLDLSEAIDMFKIRYEKLFQSIDINGDKYITPTEFKTFLLDSGCTDTDDTLDTFIAKVDSDKSGHITLEEFSFALLDLGIY